MAAVKPVLRIAALLAAAFLLAACPQSIQVTLYNNSGADRVIVLADGERVAWPEGGIFRFFNHDRRVRHEYIPGGSAPVFEVEWDAAVHAYPLAAFYENWSLARVDPPRGFRTASMYYHIQLQPDGGLYVVDGAASPPVAEPPEQPPGFPLWPSPHGPHTGELKLWQR